MASRLKAEACKTHSSEKDLSYKGVESWLKQFVELNPGANYHYHEDSTTGRFISAAIYLPADGLLEHSFLGTLHIDAGHTVTPNGSKMFLFILTMADREHRDRPIAYGWFPVENIENYRTFLKMVISKPKTATLINRVGVMCMHDRHLSFESVIREILDKVLDRLDIVHIIRNCRKYFPKLDLTQLVAAAFAKTESDHNKYFELIDPSIINYIN